MPMLSLITQAWLDQNIRFLLFVCFFILPSNNSCSLIWYCCSVAVSGLNTDVPQCTVTPVSEGHRINPRILTVQSVPVAHMNVCEGRFVNYFWVIRTNQWRHLVIGLQRGRGLPLLHSVSVHEGGVFEAAVCGPQGAGLQWRHRHGVQLPGRPVVCGRSGFWSTAVIVQLFFPFNERDRFYF